MSKSRFLTEFDEIYNPNTSRCLQTTGGLKEGTDIQNKTVKELIKEIIQPYRSPTIRSKSATSVKKEKTFKTSDNITSISISFSCEYWSDTMKEWWTSLDTSKKYTPSNPDDKYYQTGNLKLSDLRCFNQTNDVNKDDSYSYYVKGSDGVNNNIDICSGSIVYIRPFYYGVLQSDENVTIDKLTNATLASPNNYKININGGNSEQKYTYVAFPKSYKKSKLMAKDHNSFDQEWTYIGEIIRKVGDNGAIEFPYVVYKSGDSIFGAESYTFSIS